MKGISHLSHVTNTEHDQISRFLLALVADICLPDGHSNAQLVRTVHAVLDFIYLARYPIHTSETLAQMNDTLHAFHLNRDILVSLGICTHFNIPKLYNSGHYFELIQFFGAADNFNTKFTEWLHIDLAKDAYASTNFKDEFPQMTRWLEWKEHVMHHEKYICHCFETSFNMPLHVQKPLPSLIPECRQWMAKHPTHQGVPIDIICTKYGAMQFIPALSRFITQYQYSEYLKAQVEAASTSIHIPFSKISVFHRLKFVSYDVYSLNPLDKVVVDSIHTDPVHFDKYRNVVPGQFDTIVIQVKDSDDGTGLNLKGMFFMFSLIWFKLHSSC